MLQRKTDYFPIILAENYVILDCYSNKLAHVQVVINCRYSVAQLCTREDGHAYI